MRSLHVAHEARLADPALHRSALLRCCSAALVAVVLTTTSGQSLAADPATIAAMARCRSDLTADDCRLTVAGMRALAREPRLAELNLGLTIHDHIAVVWGTVPSAELRRLVEKTLLHVSGIAQVLNQLQVQPLWDEPVTPRAPPPGAPQEHSPAQSVPPTVMVTGPSPYAELRPAETAKAADSPMRVAARPVIITSEPPMAVLPRSASPTDPIVEQRLATLLRGDVRYLHLRAEVRDGMVILHGSVPSWDDLRLLATAASRLPGVERVVMDDVQCAR